MNFCCSQKNLTSNLPSTQCNLCKRAQGLRVDGGELLELGGSCGQGQQGKQQDKGQLLHLDPIENVIKIHTVYKCLSKSFQAMC